MTRVLLTDSDRFPFLQDELCELTVAGARLDVLAGHDPEDIASAGHSAAGVLVYSGRFDKSLIARLRECRILARCGAGYDNIDVQAAAERGMAVTYVPGYGADDVAEHAIALLFACARRLGRSDRAVQAGLWPSYGELGQMRRISGQTLGLLGFGRIARQVASRATGLELRVLAHDPFVEPTMDGATGPDFVSAERLFAESDFVSVHLPLTPDTRHLVGASAFALMRPQAYLINTSRGAVVDQAALAAALRAGSIAGAGLDVLAHEPPEARDELLGHPDVIITPHSAAFTQEALGEVRRTALADVVRVLRGQQPLHPVPELAGLPCHARLGAQLQMQCPGRRLAGRQGAFVTPGDGIGETVSRSGRRFQGDPVFPGGRAGPGAPVDADPEPGQAAGAVVHGQLPVAPRELQGARTRRAHEYLVVDAVAVQRDTRQVNGPGAAGEPRPVPAAPWCGDAATERDAHRRSGRQ